MAKKPQALDVGGFTGRVKINERIVDGVVDNGVDYENWISNSATYFESKVKITKNSTAILNRGAINRNHNLEVGKEYLLVYEISDKNNEENVYICTNNEIFSNLTILTISAINKTGRTTFTFTDALEVNFGTFVSSGAVDGTEWSISILVYDASIFTDPLTDPLPPSGEVDDANSIILSDNYNHVFTTDTTNILTENGANKVVPIADVANITNQQLFVNKDEPSIAYYDESLTGDCLEKAKKLSKVE